MRDRDPVTLTLAIIVSLTATLLGMNNLRTFIKMLAPTSPSNQSMQELIAPLPQHERIT